MTPTPVPSPVLTELPVDADRVTPGLLSFFAFAFLILAIVVIYYSMRKQLGRINFEEGKVPAGNRPLPQYATKAERRKTARRLQKEQQAAAAAAAAQPDSEAVEPPAAASAETPQAPAPGSDPGSTPPEPGPGTHS